MRRFTIYRVDVDSPRLSRLVGRVPGIAVADDEGAEPAAEETPVAEGMPAATVDEADDSGGLREKVPVPDTDVDAKSAVKTYGLLGLGASMIMLGIATVGIWVYRRRAGGDGESETPPPATGDPVPTSEAPTTPTETALSTPEEREPESPSPDLSIVTPDEADEAGAEPFGRTEGDHSEVEWATRERPPTDEPTTADAAPEPSDAESADTASRPGESIDAAPLLGVAFVAASGAIVRWLQGGDEA